MHKIIPTTVDDAFTAARRERRRCRGNLVRALKNDDDFTNDELALYFVKYIDADNKSRDAFAALSDARL